MPGLVNRTRFLQATPEAPFATSVHASGRYLLDQFGQPFLVRGASPWMMMAYLSDSFTDIETYFSTRQSQGFNTVIVTLVPPLNFTNSNGTVTGGTIDGVYPFTGQPSSVDVTTRNSTYWARVDSMFSTADSYEFTVFALPMDWWGWVEQNGNSTATVVAQGTAGWQNYGEFVGARYANRSNVIWMFGHDYDSADWSTGDQYVSAFEAGLRNGGANQIGSLHNWQLPSRDHTGLAALIDFDLAYEYVSIYSQVIASYGLTPAKPVLHGETSYELENNDAELPGPADAHALRRQMLWALTSGAVGTFYGHRDEYGFTGDWQAALSTTAVTQHKALLDWWETLAWWTIQPDNGSVLLTAGRGTHSSAPMTSTYATVGRDTSGTTPATLVVIYIPTARTVSIDETKISGTVTATWVDPTSAATQSATGSGGDYTMPGNNAAGNANWLLLLRGT